MPVPVGTMFIRLRSFSKCVPAPRPCALYRRKETRSSGHTRKRMRNTLSRRRTEAHRASPEERDGVFPHIPPSTTRALPSDKKKYREVHTHMHRNFLFITQKFFVFRWLRFCFCFLLRLHLRLFPRAASGPIRRCYLGVSMSAVGCCLDTMNSQTIGSSLPPTPYFSYD